MELNPSPGMTFKFRIHHLLTLVLFCFAAATSGLVAIILYGAAMDRVDDDIRQRLRDIVAIAPLVVDVADFDSLTDPSREGSPAHMRVRSALQKVRDATSDIHFIYTLRSAPDGAIIFVVDPESDPELVVHLGDIYEAPSDLLREHFSTMDGPIVESRLYTDEWGTWLSGYAPIIRPDGTRAGVVGVDISASTVGMYRRTLLILAMGSFGLTLPLILLGGYLLGRRLARPVQDMKEAADLFRQGNLDVRIPVKRGDELGVLAATLNDMAAGLKRSQAGLSEMAEKYRSIFEGAVEGIYQTTPEGRFLTANAAMLHMTGYESLEDLQAHFTDTKTQLCAFPEEREALVAELQARGEVHGHQVTFRRKDGSHVRVELSAKIVAGAGRQTIIEGMAQDITERVERERAERERHAAEAASRAKSEFLANMSHEIRTPLNAIMGLTDLLRRTELNERQSEYFRKILVSSRALLAVINDILDFSKIEAGRLELEEAPFSLLEVMANLSEMFAQTAGEKEIELLMSIDPDVPVRLSGDAVRLGQVLINLTGNAVKFTPRGEILVSVALAQGGDEEHVEIEFRVRDTGIGIPADRQGAIFDSFTQTDSSITRRHGGTGLGLAICKKLVGLMGGDIRVESRPGRGSTFTFTARFGRLPEKEQLRPKAPADMTGLRVLIVDDNATSRQILSASVESFQMRATTAASGGEALEILQEASNPFDLILMDWKMPGLNGIETARRIRRIHPGTTDRVLAPIICMVSAYGREDLLQESDKNLLDAFLHKPVNQSLLFDTIMGLFGRRTDFAGMGPAAGEDDEARVPIRLAGARILLVEDNAVNQDVAREWLESGGMAVTVADNGRVALEMLAARSFDAVLMDIQMPEMDGLEATRRIRADSIHNALPVIGMTAHALKGDREKGLAAGMDDYVTKPIDPQVLFSTLNRWIKDGPRRPPAPPSPTEVSRGAEPDLSGLSLPGIDVALGLYRANSKASLYLRLLSTFADDFATAEADMVGYLERGDTDGARRLAHSIKGVAGNIGAMDLSRAAGVVEEATVNRTLAADSEAWDSLRSALVTVLGGLSTALPGLKTEQDSFQPGAEPAGERLEGEKLAASLRELAATLDDDLEAGRSLLAALRPSLEADDARSLDEHLDAFDIDSAVSTVKEILVRLGQGDEKNA